MQIDVFDSREACDKEKWLPEPHYVLLCHPKQAQWSLHSMLGTGTVVSLIVVLSQSARQCRMYPTVEKSSQTQPYLCIRVNLTKNLHSTSLYMQLTVNINYMYIINNNACK